MNIALWVVQILLAFAFGMAGFFKAFTPLDQLATQMPWVADVPGWVPRLAGLAELAGATGLLLPALTRIKPVLTALAGLGLLTVMVFASLFHLSRGEVAMLAPNFILGALAAFVWWGRTKRVPITPRVSEERGRPAYAER
jgi:uncharacterized membrane protein YphA (DoxX/SURF4 family)